MYGQGGLTVCHMASKSAYFVNLQTCPTWHLIFLTAIIVTFSSTRRLVPGKFEMSVGKGFATLAKTCYTPRMAILTRWPWPWPTS